MDLTPGYPFWPVLHGLLRTYPSLDQDVSCDVAVIGGGITGALVGWHLVEAGMDVVVVDRRDVGRGSTAASTSLLQYEIDTPLTELATLVGADHAARAYLACRDAIGKMAHLAARLPDTAGFTRNKSLYLASRRRDVKAPREELDARAEASVSRF